MTTGRDFLKAIGVQNNAFERMFFEWIESYNGEGELDILEAFGETMLALDRFIDCRWGCDDDHPEKHLLATCVTRIRAILPLTACGYPSEAGALFRPLGEGVNLMALLAASHDELEAYRHGSKKQRRNTFSAARVRGKLKRKCLKPPLNKKAYGRLSDFYLHPNALGHIFGHRTSHEGEGFDIPYFHRDMCISMFIALISAAATALLFWACAQEDDSDFRLAHAFNERDRQGIARFHRKDGSGPNSRKCIYGRDRSASLLIGYPRCQKAVHRPEKANFVLASVQVSVQS